MDAELARQVRELVRTMRDNRRHLEQTLEQVQVLMFRVQINAAELVDRAGAIQVSLPAGPAELVDETVAARGSIAESYQVERFWRRAGVEVAGHPEA